MSQVLVFKFPGWRTFVFHVPTVASTRNWFTSLLGHAFRSPIFKAIEEGNDEKALRLATPRRLKTSRGELGESPLVAAIAAGRDELAIKLIELGGTFTNDGALAHSAMRGNLQLVDALLAKGKSPDEPLPSDLEEGRTPLMWATSRKFYACIERLLAAGANINAQSKVGMTAAMYTKNGTPEDLSALEILCKYSPDISTRDWRGRNLIREAIDRECNSGDAAMRQLLERYFPEIGFEKNNT
jgi:uncharacterized protein